MPERIVAAAIIFRNVDVICFLQPPARHHTIINKLANAIPESLWPVCNGDETGFITSTGRYVDRIEAGRIAIAAGQTKALAHGPALYSEDLW